MIARVAAFAPSVFAEITALAQQHAAVNLGQGFPDFDTPEHVKQSACKAITDGRNQYAVSHGEPVLRVAIADHARRFYSHTVDPDSEVCVTSGASEALWCAAFAFVEPGDEVIVFEPCFDVYIPNISMAGGKVVPVTLHAPSFRFDPDELKAAFTSRTRLILINTPHNPCGTVFNDEELSLIRDLCVEHDVIALCDEVYEHIVFEPNIHRRLAAMDGMQGRCVTVSSGGKTFSSTGWKCGWAIGAEPLITSIRRIHQYTVFASNTPVQYAIAEGLMSDADFYTALRVAYTERRRRILDALKSTPFVVHEPEGSYFVAADISRFSDLDSVQFSKELITAHGIAVIPMQKFYMNEQAGRSLVRIAFCKNDATLQLAHERFEAFTAHCNSR